MLQPMIASGITHHRTGGKNVNGISRYKSVGARPDVASASEVSVSSRFLVHQNRVEYETYTFIGRRRDMLRRVGSNWKIARREIILEQSILLAKNLTTFF